MDTVQTGAGDLGVTMAPDYFISERAALDQAKAMGQLSLEEYLESVQFLEAVECIYSQYRARVNQFRQRHPQVGDAKDGKHE